MTDPTIDTINQRYVEVQPFIDGLRLDLSNMGVSTPDDADPEDYDEPTRHYLLAMMRAELAQSELARSALAIDDTWIPPQTDTT